MPSYKVIKDCHWHDCYFDEGGIVDIPEGQTPPEHFQLIDGNGKAIERPVITAGPEPKTLSELGKENRDSAPKTGINYTPPPRKGGRPAAVSESI